MIAFICTAVHDPSDRDFMLWVYQEFEKLMFSTARKYTADSSAREDIVQDGLVRLIQKVDVLRPMERCILAGYIVSTIRNTAINYLKSQGAIKKHVDDVDEDEFENIASKAPSMDELMILAERKAQLTEIWPKLPETDRVLLDGKYILGYTDEELAPQLKCSAASVRMKLTRARRNALELMIEKEKVSSYDET